MSKELNLSDMFAISEEYRDEPDQIKDEIKGEPSGALFDYRGDRENTKNVPEKKGLFKLFKQERAAEPLKVKQDELIKGFDLKFRKQILKIQPRILL